MIEFIGEVISAFLEFALWSWLGESGKVWFCRTIAALVVLAATAYLVFFFLHR